MVSLTIDGRVIDIPTTDNFVVDQLQPLVKIVANEQDTTTNAAGDRTLVRRALHVQVLGVAPAPPVANIVLAESRVGTRGAVCAPAACPAGSVPQPGNPLVCIVMRETPSGPCAKGSLDDPNSNNCLFVIERPCPSGAKPDPTTRVCVATSGGGATAVAATAVAATAVAATAVAATPAAAPATARTAPTGASAAPTGPG